MRAQIDFSRRSEFQSFVSGLSNLEKAADIIHGIFIDIHPMYASLADVNRRTGLSPTDRYGLIGGYGPPILVDDEGTINGPYELESEFLPSFWTDICEHEQKIPSPFIVKIYILPTTPETFDLRRRIEAYARSAPFFVSILDRPMAVMSASLEGGLDLTASTSGTLGGFLEDAAGNHWGVTCGHVCQSSGTTISLTDVGGTMHAGAGTVRHSNFHGLIKKRQASFCNPYSSNSNPDVDAALVELDPSHSALNTVYSSLKIDTIYDRTQLGSGCTVWVRGAASGSHDYIVRGYGVSLQVQFSRGSSDYYCFSNVFELNVPTSGPSWFPGRLATALSARLLQGDSGAWVLFNRTANLYAYYGNVFAVQGINAYATFSDSVQAWAKNDHSLDLNPF